MAKMQFDLNNIPTISFDEIEEEAECVYTEPTLPNEFISSHSKIYAEVHAATTEKVNKYLNDCTAAWSENVAYRLHKQQYTKDLITERCKQLDAMNDRLEIWQDFKQLNSLHDTLDKDLIELKQKYGGNEILEDILSNYVEKSGFKIVHIHETEDAMNIVIKFIINGELINAFPVHIEIATGTKTITNIETKIYPQKKLMTWLNTHNCNIPDFVINLKKTLVNVLSIRKS